MQWAALFGTFPVIATTSVFKYLYPIWVFLLFFSMAGHFVLMPAACSRIFGPKNTATTYGLLYFTTVSYSAFTKPRIFKKGIEWQITLHGVLFFSVPAHSSWLPLCQYMTSRITSL